MRPNTRVRRARSRYLLDSLAQITDDLNHTLGRVQATMQRVIEWRDDEIADVAGVPAPGGNAQSGHTSHIIDMRTGQPIRDDGDLGYQG